GQPPEEERPRTPERAPQPEAAQAEQPAGAGPLLGQALHERIAQAIRPGLGELPQRTAQGRQLVEQAGPEEQQQAGPEEQQEEEQPPQEEQPHAEEPEATQSAVPARVLDKEGRLSAEPKRGRVNWRL